MKLKIERFNKSNRTQDIASISTFSIILVPIVFMCLFSFGTKYQTDMKEVVYQSIQHENSTSDKQIENYNKKYNNKVNISYDKEKHIFTIISKKTDLSIMMNAFYDLNTKRKIEYIVLNDKKLQVSGVPELDNKFNHNSIRTSPLYSKFLEENQKSENILLIKMSN